MTDYQRIQKILNDDAELAKCLAHLRENTKDGDKEAKRLALIKYIRELYSA